MVTSRQECTCDLDNRVLVEHKSLERQLLESGRMLKQSTLNRYGLLLVTVESVLGCGALETTTRKGK